MNAKSDKAKNTKNIIDAISTKISGTIGEKEQVSPANPGKDIKELENKYETLKTLFENKTKEFEKKIDEKETKTTEILAIFIGLFTFISVNVSLFTRLQDMQTAIWFMLIMTFCLTFFLSFLFIIINKTLPNRITFLGLIISLVTLLLLAVLPKILNWNIQLNSEKDSTYNLNLKIK